MRPSVRRPRRSEPDDRPTGRFLVGVRKRRQLAIRRRRNRVCARLTLPHTLMVGFLVGQIGKPLQTYQGAVSEPVAPLPADDGDVGFLQVVADAGDP